MSGSVQMFLQENSVETRKVIIALEQSQVKIRQNVLCYIYV